MTDPLSRHNGMQQVLVIVGPTSSGKSALGVRLARLFNGEIVSADSRQVYRGLDIGTGKVTKREMKGVRHHLLDVADPRRQFTAHEFIQKGRAAIADIAKRGKLPIVVGGTGFYIDALLGRITLPDVPANAKLRARLEKKSAAQLLALLKKRDPRRAKMMDTPSERNNKRRLVRALEVSYEDFVNPNLGLRNPNFGFDTLWVGLTLQSNVLNGRIRARLLSRMRQGMIAEAKRLHKAGLSYKRMDALGLEYRSLSRFLQGKITREQMLAELDTAIRQYAKRQMTYWRRNEDIAWFSPTAKSAIERRVRTWLK